MPTSLVLGSARAQFTITLSAPATEPVSVGWLTRDGTALAGRDYEANSGTVVFAPGETSKTVEVFVHGRTVETEDRVFYMLMIPPVNAILADEVGACVIHVDTAGSQPVMTVVIPKGEKGERGYSAYEIALQNGFVGTEAEWLASLRPSPEELAPLVAPLIDAGSMNVTAKGTEGTIKVDRDSIAAFAGRIAHMGPVAKSVAPALIGGVNIIPFASFVGDIVEPDRIAGFRVAALRGGSIAKLKWRYLRASNEIRIENGVAGDIPIAIQHDIGSGNVQDGLVDAGGVQQELQAWIEELKEHSENTTTLLADFIAALASAGGDSQVRHDADETVHQAIEWRTTKTVEAFGAMGYPHDDTEAFRRMFNETGRIVVRNRRYKVPHLILTANVGVFVGAQCPQINNTRDGLVDGTGSIIEGTIMFRVKHGFYRNFGYDAGPATSLPADTEGFVSDPEAYTVGGFFDIANIITVGSGPGSLTHGCLYEGYEGIRSDNVTVANRYYGQVCKSRNGSITNATGWNVGSATVFVKSDIPDFAGWVDGSVRNVNVRGVISYCPDLPAYADCCGVTVMASSTALSEVKVTDVTQTNGRAALVIQGGFDDVYTVDVTADNIVANNCFTVMEAGGTSYDTHIGSLQGSNYRSGHLFRMGVLTNNWRVDSATGLISDPAITTAEAMFAFGTGSWGHIQVRNGVLPAGGQVVPHVVGVTPGTVSGDVRLPSDGPLIMQDGWATTDANAVSAGRRVSLSGTVDSATASSLFISTQRLIFPTTVQYHPVVVTKAGVFSMGVVRVWVNGIVLLSPALTNDLKVDLSGISWNIE